MPSKTVQIVLGLVSLAMFVGTLVAIPIVVVRLHEDHFVRPPPRHSLGVKIARNVLGALLVAFGVLMLVLPGQGILTIVLGLSILDVPLKHRVVRRLLRRPAIVRAVQSLRAKAKRPPLRLPSDDDTRGDRDEDLGSDDLSSPGRGARSASAPPGSSRPSTRSS